MKLKTKMSQETSLRVINYFWMGLTIIIAICTLYVSVRTIIDMIHTKSQISTLDEKIEVYEAKIERDSIFIENIKHNPEFMETYARERYHMQRPGETVYILEE